MTFEPIRANVGQPRVNCVCDDCGRGEVVAAVHGKSGKDGFGQAAHKIQAQGWTYLHKHLRCPACEAKRKVVKLQQKEAQKPDEPPREPTRQERRDIMAMLDDVYDIEAGRYQGGDNDDTVADVLGVLPGWVSEIRCEFFGESGENSDIADLLAEIAEYRERLDGQIDGLQKLRAEASAFAARLERINGALSARIAKRVG